MFKKILIANRGEIACRIIRTAKKLNITCVAIYSDADSHALHVKLADEAYRIGPAPSNESYLKGNTIIEIAQHCAAQAIHPGYGFLAENADFAEACEKAGLIFIGPPSATIRAMGSKSLAKQMMKKAGVPLLPGYHGDDQRLETFVATIQTIGYPVLLKAAAGGGGKGMRIVRQEQELAEALHSAKREALASFGNDKMLVEKYLNNPRHIEVQIFSDSHGNTLHLFDRDCSIQRRHQKILEEAPAPNLSEKLRTQIHAAAIKAAQAIHYVGAGTIEFLLDDQGDFYFMEMNTRLQVEHPVTEMITQQDLVAWQFNIAVGQPLPVKQKELTCSGHALEVRIYAEDPDNHFLPSIGKIKHLLTPEENAQIRIDTGIVEGDAISIYYDPMIAKLIVWNTHRDIAIQHLQKALNQFQVIGVTTNIHLLLAIVNHPAFIAGELDTDFIPKHHDALFAKATTIPDDILALASLYILLKQQHQARKTAEKSADPYSPWYLCDGWRLNLTNQQLLQFSYENICFNITAHYQENGYSLELPNSKKYVTGKLVNQEKLQANLGGKMITVTLLEDQNTLHVLADKHYRLHRYDPNTSHQHDADLNNSLTSPMPGKIIALLAHPGDHVERGAHLLVIEAMKMEHTIRAPQNGVVKQYYYNIGDIVDEGVELLAFEIN